MADLKFANFGAGWWTQIQLAGWQELEGVKCTAIYNRTRSKAEATAKRFGIPAVYDDPQELLRNEELDFIDIVTDLHTHKKYVKMAAEHKIPVICQKPLAPSLEDAEEMLDVCNKAGVPFYVHENWRWQEPIRQFKNVLDKTNLGKIFRARINWISSYPVFDNQPFLKEMEQFMIAELGSHILDAARWLFGEAHNIYCQNQQVRNDIKGEDMSTIMMAMGKDRTTVTCEMSFSSIVAYEHFPETFIYVEGEKGAIDLLPEFWVRVTTKDGIHLKQYPPPKYAWADPDYGVGQVAVLPCNADFLKAFQTGGQPETTAEDNLKTIRLIYAAYESAKDDKTIDLSKWRQ
ncbi:MAG: Gfo/Idh/MocA family protein [Planctomycetota bacterium]|jgi:predicted dehydrogenase